MRLSQAISLLICGLYVFDPASAFQPSARRTSCGLRPITFPKPSSNDNHGRHSVDILRQPIIPYFKQGTVLQSSSSSSSSSKDDIYFSRKTTVALVGGQSLLVLIAAVLGSVLGVPNHGLGPDISFTVDALKAAALYTLPLVVLAAVLDVVEDKVPALQDVTKATQRSVLSLLGGTFKPLLGLVTAAVLGMAAGFGEEMLFRGILQYELLHRFNWSSSPTVAIGLSSVLFGALHAVTPMYAALATVASVYFGVLYAVTGNLAVPILCHALYDVGALLYAHWTVSRLPEAERATIAAWGGPAAGPL